MSKNSKTRVLYEVSPFAFGAGLLGWKVTRNLRDDMGTFTIAWFSDKEVAITYAVNECRFMLKSLHYNSELKIKNKWGVISKDTRTYGDDPDGNG